MGRLRVGVTGTGGIAALHAQSLREADIGFEVVYDVDASRAEAFVSKHGGRAVGTYEELLDNCDVVWICTPPSAHLEAVEAAALADKAIFCEKPIAPTLKDAREIASLASTVPNQVGLVLRSSESYIQLRERVAADGPVEAAVSRIEMAAKGLFDGTWRRQKDIVGGGILIELAFHDVDLMLWTLGPVERVSCTTASVGEVEDVAMCVLEFESGALGTLTAIWHGVRTRPWGRSIEVVTPTQWLNCDPGTLRWHGPDGEGEQSYGVAHNPGQEFLRAIERGEPASPSLQDALRVHEVVEAAYQSAEQGRAIEVASLA